MKIYAIRDRLLDYYMQPFAGPGDKPVLASIATMINQQGERSDIAQAPHHFEVWELGEIDQEGHITPTRKLLADCASLVRPGIRERSEPGIPPPLHPEISRHRAPEDIGGGNGADPSPLQATAPTAPSARA